MKQSYLVLYILDSSGPIDQVRLSLGFDAHCQHVMGCLDHGEFLAEYADVESSTVSEKRITEGCQPEHKAQ
jgi:hypothetical protein